MRTGTTETNLPRLEILGRRSLGKKHRQLDKVKLYRVLALCKKKTVSEIVLILLIMELYSHCNLRIGELTKLDSVKDKSLVYRVQNNG